MDEEKVTTQNEIDNTMCCAMPPSSASKMAMELRLMMDKAEGEDKCILCKAAEELEKLSTNQSTGWSFPWLFMIMFLICDGFGGNKGVDIEALNAYMDAIKKKSKESDSNLQNES